jgi:hypothetical protein
VGPTGRLGGGGSGRFGFACPEDFQKGRKSKKEFSLFSAGNFCCGAFLNGGLTAGFPSG